MNDSIFFNFFLENLPSGENYEKSFMHRDTVTHVRVTHTDFIITASQDGHIKFWKKLEVICSNPLTYSYLLYLRTYLKNGFKFNYTYNC